MSEDDKTPEQKRQDDLRFAPPGMRPSTGAGAEAGASAGHTPPAASTPAPAPPAPAAMPSLPAAQHPAAFQPAQIQPAPIQPAPIQPVPLRTSQPAPSSHAPSHTPPHVPEPKVIGRTALWIRSIAAALCLLVAILATGASVLAIGVYKAITDPNQFSQVSAATIKQGEAQDLAARQIIDAVWEQVPRAQVLAELFDYLKAHPDSSGLPEGLVPDVVAAALAEGRADDAFVKAGIDETLDKWLLLYVRAIVQSVGAESVWQDANRASHAVLVQALRGKRLANSEIYRGESVYIDLTGFVGVWQDSPTGLAQIDNAVADLRLVLPYVGASDIHELKPVFSTLNTARLVLPVVAIGALVVGAALMPRRRAVYLLAGALGALVVWLARTSIANIPAGVIDSSAQDEPTLGTYLSQHLDAQIGVSVLDTARGVLVAAVVLLVLAVLWQIVVIFVRRRVRTRDARREVKNHWNYGT